MINDHIFLLFHLFFFSCFRFIFVIIFMSRNTYSFINVDWILIILNMLLYGSSFVLNFVIFINFTNNLTFEIRLCDKPNHEKWKMIVLNISKVSHFKESFRISTFSHVEHTAVQTTHQIAECRSVYVVW